MTQERGAQTAAEAAAAGVADAKVGDPVEIEEIPPAQLPPVEPRAANGPPEHSGPRSLRDSSPGAKKKNRMTLRIPDDEVSRPTPAVTSEAPPPVSATAKAEATPSTRPPSSPDMTPLKPMRVITISDPPATEAPPIVPPDPPTQRILRADKDKEDSWTPYQPTAADGAPVRPSAISDDLIPITSEPEIEPPPDSGEPADVIEVTKAPPVLSRPPPPSGKMRSAPPVQAPPAQPAPPAVAAPKPAAQARASEPEGEEVRFDDEEPAPTVAGDRTSDSGDEISADDMVESVPSPKPLAPPKPAPPPSGVTKALQVNALPPMRARAQSVPSIPPKDVPPPMRARAPSIPSIGRDQVPASVAQPQPQPQPAAPPQFPTPARAPLVIVPPHVGVTPPAPDPSQRRKARPWWEELFNDDFIRTMAKISDEQIAEEADFIEDSLAVARGGTMLDLACGTGRHAIDLSKRGYEVVGFDLSLAMLARAADEAQDRSAKLNFVQGDMREMTFEEAFDGVFSWNTSFGFFDEETNAKVIGKVHRALKKGGQLLLDVVNRDFISRQAPSLAWFEGDGCVCMDEMSIDWITSRMKVKRTLMMDDGRSREIEYSVRVYSLHELGRILHEQGFRVAEVSGRTATPGVFFGAESPRTLILAEKR